MLQSLSILFGLALQFADVSPPTQAALTKAADYSEQYRGQSCVVMFDGNVIFSRYAAGGGPDKLQMLASGSKSFVGLAAVAAVQDGHLSLDDPVSGSIPEWNESPAKRRITYRQLLNLTSGLTGGERGRPDEMPPWKEIASRPLASAPGQQFSYGAHHLNTFAYALQRKLGDETFEAYLKRRILDRSAFAWNGASGVGTAIRRWAVEHSQRRPTGRSLGNSFDLTAAGTDNPFSTQELSPAVLRVRRPTPPTD